MFENRDRIRNAICILLTVIVAAGIGRVAYTSNQAEREYSAALQNMLSEVQPYEEELQKLQAELEEREDFSWTSSSAKIVVGFYVELGSDIEFVRAQVDEYGLEPVLILDCCQDIDTLAFLISKASETGWEVMLTASDFSDNVIEAVLDVRTYLERNGLVDTGVFLFMDGDNSKENIRCIMDNGFIGYAKYDVVAPSSGYTGDDSLYFDYVLVQTVDELNTDGITELINEKESMLIAFDMDSIHKGTLTKQEVIDVLNALRALSKEDDLLLSSVSDVIDGLLELETLRTEYNNELLQKQERVIELEAIIDEIYSEFAWKVS